MGTPTNVKVGVCNVNYGGVDLGFTQGGVEVEVKTETHSVMVDQFGKTKLDERIIGRSVSVKCPLAETTLQNLVKVMPGASIVGTGSNIKVVVPTGTGISLLAAALPLILHPIYLPATDHSEDFTIPLASTPGSLQFAYMLEKERIFNLTFSGFADATGRLFVVGDETVAG